MNNKSKKTDFPNVDELKEDFQTIPPEKLTAIFEKALEYEKMKDLIAKQIASTLKKDDDVKAILVKMVDDVNHNKWRLIYTKTYSTILPFITLIVGWILSQFFGK